MADEREFWFGLKPLKEQIAGTVCNDDYSGTRHAFRCSVAHSQVEEVWERSVYKKARKVYIAKESNQGGSERLQIWHGDNLIVDQVIGPGTKGDFLPGDKSNIRVRISTTSLDENGVSRYYAHVEWYS